MSDLLSSNLVSMLRTAKLESGEALRQLRRDAAGEIERLTAECAEHIRKRGEAGERNFSLSAELEHARAEARSMHSAYETSVKVSGQLRATLERAGQRLTSLAKQARCRCQSTAGYTHHCEACRALKAAEDIVVMLRGDVPARAADETTGEQK